MIIVNPGDEAFLTYDWYPHKFGLPVTIDHKSSWTYVQLSMEATRSDWTEDNELSGETAPNYDFITVEATNLCRHFEASLDLSDNWCNTMKHSVVN